MPIFAISNVGKFGIVKDLAPHELPMEAFSDGAHVRFAANYAEKLPGFQNVFGTPSVPPLWAMFAPSLSEPAWIYAGTAKVYATEGTTHYNITRQTASVDVDYTGGISNIWNGGVLSGIPVFTNGVDLPQYWAPHSYTQRLQNLTDWPSDARCAVIKPFKQYLVAANITKASVRYPYMVKWSHPAAPGTLPGTWDETDPTYDAGEYDFAEDSGFVLDMHSLRDINVVYREGSVWGMQAVADSNIFRFFRMFNSFGALGLNCVTEFVAGKHLVFSTNDILIHDGQNAESILQDRVRAAVFRDIDTAGYRNSYVIRIMAANEVWCCYPSPGNTWADKAVVWNWKTGAVGFKSLGGLTYMTTGVVPDNVSSDLWSMPGSWEDLDKRWGERNFTPAQENQLIVSYDGNFIAQHGIRESANGTPIPSMLERTGLGIPFKQGQPPDMSSMKFLRNVWPRISGTIGAVVNVEVGYQMEVDGPVTWYPPKEYVIGTTKKIDCLVSGRLLAVRFSSNTNMTWRLHGYELDVSLGGNW
jgi:hypothetical protein